MNKEQTDYEYLLNAYLRILNQLVIKCPYCESVLSVAVIKDHKLVQGKDMFGNEVWCSHCDTYLLEGVPKKGRINL